MFRGARPNIINLSRSYAYQSRGYYASLLAAARGQRVIPSVETIIDLSARKLYENAIPELEDSLNKSLRGQEGEPLPSRLRIYFGTSTDARLERFGRLLFDWFRAPVLELTLKNGDWISITRIGLQSIGKLDEPGREAFFQAMARYTARQWKDAKSRAPARYSFATLVDPDEALPPSSIDEPQALVAHRRPHGGFGRADRPQGPAADWPISMRCSSAKPPRSPTIPTASPAAPSRRACR
jgi:hypothetical protein